MNAPTGYKLLEEGEEIKSGYLVLTLSQGWVKGGGLLVGGNWGSLGLRPMANPITESTKPAINNLPAIVNSTIEIYSCNILRNHVPDYKLNDLNKKTGLDLDTLRKIRDIVQES